MWTEILTGNDERIHSEQMTEAVKKELDCLFGRGTCKIVLASDEPDANILPSSFVFAIKHTEEKKSTRLGLCLEDIATN